ncbi:MAG: hypothetical protein LBQ82_06020 [Treponema sp.]|jgi:outer membrane murein-binding lipoprotein Lpp|nr:hypothetical protein [Treponema sp.]
MKKKILGIAVILFVFFVAGISAQSKEADQLISRLEGIARVMENLAQETKNAKAFEKSSLENRMRTNQRNLEQLRDEYVRFLRDGGKFSDTQERRWEVGINRFVDAAQQFSYNLQNLVN